MNTRFLSPSLFLSSIPDSQSERKNSGRGKVGLREMKKTERKRSEGEMEVGELYERSSSSLLVRKLLDVAPIVKLDISNY